MLKGYCGCSVLSYETGPNLRPGRGGEKRREKGKERREMIREGWVGG